MAESMERNILLNYEDYLSLPADRNRNEILEGELIVTPSPTFEHQEISQNLAHILYFHIKKNGLGKLVTAPMDVLLDENTIVQPDIIFISAEKLRRITKRGIESAPDLLVEILSTGSKRYDRLSKMQIYGKHGVPWYWIVDPETSTLEEYRLESSHYLPLETRRRSSKFTPGLFPGLVIDLALVWA